MGKIALRTAKSHRREAANYALARPVLPTEDAAGFQQKVRPCEFNPGDLVLRKVLHITPDSRGKFAYKYDGPYVVKEVFSGGAIILADMDGNKLVSPINVDAIKKYYP